MANKHPRIVGFFQKRFDRTTFTGLPLTVFGGVFFYVLLLFLGAIADFITADTIISADARVNALLYAFRNAAAVKVFIWITLLGESPAIIVFALAVSVFLYLSRKRWQIIALWLTIIGSEGLTFIAKIIFHRPRPLNAVFQEDSNSFPSGHATIAVAFYGFLTYLLLRNSKNKKYRVLVTFLGILIVLAIGASRLYLGVHYVSDVWTGYLVGLLWLIVGIGITEWKFFQVRSPNRERKTAHAHIGVTLVGIALMFYVAYGISYTPIFIPKAPITVQATVSSTTEIFRDYNIPRYTETLTGETQEPISVVITAHDDAVFVTHFKNAGWSVADPVDVHSTLQAIEFAISNTEYSTAPMTPSFWNKQVHDFGFEKSTEAKSVRQRHHARFWKTNLKTTTGESIYVGTTSLDTGIKWLITHKISPDIDTERELLFADLEKTLAVKNFQKVKLVRPVLGQNFTGDQFFTDGGAYFISF